MKEPHRTKIIHIVNSLRIGGAEKNLCNLVKHTDKERFEIEIFCLYWRGELCAELQDHDVQVKVLELDRRLNPLNWLKVRKELTLAAPAVVHTHLPEGNWYGQIAARTARVPVRVAHLQNTYRNWSRRTRQLDRFAARFARRSIACSEAVRRFFVDEIGYEPTLVTTVYNSVDLDGYRNLPAKRASRDAVSLPQSSPILLSVASLTEQKGHRFLLDAVAEVVAEHPDVLLVLVGEGALRADLEDRVIQLGIIDNVRFMGTRLDVPLLMAAADTFVLPSLWEGMGLVLVEAGAAGLPCVASKVDGVPEIIEDGVTGLLVAPAAPRELARALRVLLDDQQLMARMGAEGKARVQAQFDVRTAVRRIEALYEELLDSGK